MVLNPRKFTAICDEIASGTAPPLACVKLEVAMRDFIRYRREHPETESEYALALETFGEIVSADNLSLHESVSHPKLLETVISARDRYLQVQLPDKFAPRSSKTVTHRVDADNLASALESAMKRLPPSDQAKHAKPQAVEIATEYRALPPDSVSGALPQNVEISAESLFDDTGGAPPPTPRFRE